MVADWSDEEIWRLSRGGHDYRKLYAAYLAAMNHQGRPTVILAKTIKGWTLGSHFEGRNSTHQMKKLTLEDLKDFRDRLQMEIPDSELDPTCRRTTAQVRAARFTVSAIGAERPQAVSSRRAHRLPTT